jgi:hypothetical protein
MGEVYHQAVFTERCTLAKNMNNNKLDILNSSPVALKTVCVGPMAPRPFSTGSVGYHYSGKAQLLCSGKPYNFQVGLTITVANSKPGSKSPVSATKVEEFLASGPKTLEQLGLSEACAFPKEFSTGSIGYNFSGKSGADGLVLQVGVNITAVGSQDWGKAAEELEAKIKAEREAKLEALLA